MSTVRQFDIYRLEDQKVLYNNLCDDVGDIVTLRIIIIIYCCGDVNCYE